MFGYDTPEMKPPLSKPNRQEEIAKAIAAKEHLEQLLANRYLEIEFFDYCKYGRPLANLYSSERYSRFCAPKTFVLVNKVMVDSQHAKEYYGKTKPEW
jgi:endonuclease YncB( thermonuclease family)